MKFKAGHYYLSPNEEAQIMKEETERRRKLRLQQVREQAKQNAATIRQAVRQEKDRQIHKLASQLQNQLEKEKEEKVRKLEAQYENCLKSIGQGHTEAGEQVDRGEELLLMKQEDNRKAGIRGNEAVKRMKHEKIYKEYEETKIINARKNALEVEKERALNIASLPAPDPDPVLNIETIKRKPVKMTDTDNFCTTHYHMAEEVAVDKADPSKQEDARLAAEEEEIKTKQKDLDRVRLHNDRLTRARVRHNDALEKEMLHHDYGNILADLSDLQRADRERRQRVVANIPKQVFEPPHRRMEDREDKQKGMEEAFEDMYMAETKYVGDLSLALDPHPPPDTPTAMESLEVSVLDDTPIPEPSLTTVPSVLKDMTNTPRKPSDKKPEKVLKKLMDKIKTQRQEWMSKSTLDIPENDVIKDTASEPPSINGHRETEIEGAPTLSQYSLSESELPYLEPGKVLVQPVIHRQPHDHKPQSYGHKPESSKAPHRDTIQARWAEPKPLLHPVEVAAKGRPDKQKETSKVADYSPPVKGPSERTVESILQQQKAIDPIHKLLEYGTKLVEEKRELVAKLRQLEQQKQEILSKSATMTTATVTKPITSTVTSAGPASVQLSSARLVPQFTDSQPKSSGFYGISELPTHLMHSNLSPSASQNLPDHPAKSLSDSLLTDNGLINALTSISQNMQHFAAPKQSTGMNGMSTGLRPPLPVGAYLSSAARHPATLLPSTLPPVPQTVSGVILPSSERDQHSEHLKKIKDYQQSLLKKHEQSKKVLADTRAEIEHRRMELLERFPQLELKSPESDHSIDVTAAHLATAHSTVPVRLPTPGGRSDAGEKPPSLAKTSNVSALLKRLASHPYYVSKLSQPGEMQKFADSVFGREFHQALHPSIGTQSSSKVQTTDSKTMKDKVRKSLPFDESLGESPIITALSKYGDISTENETEDEGRLGRKSELDDSHLSSSTDRGSPALPARRSIGKSGVSSDSETDVSLLASKDPRTEMYERRQEEIRRQLAEIQRQKEKMLQHHLQGQRKLIEQKENLKEKLKMAERRDDQASESDVTLTDLEKSDMKGFNDTTLSGDTTALDTTDLSSDASPDLKAQLKQLPTVSRPTASALLGSHKAHDLSTIQEVDTPASTRHTHTTSGTDARASLSGSDHSSTRRSLDFNQHPAIMEEAESSEKGPSPTNRRTVGDTGYFTGQLADVLSKARELDPTILDKLKQQTNDVFSTLDDSVQHQGGITAYGSFHSLSGGSLSPSLSAGAVDNSNRSLTSPATSDGSYAFKVVPKDSSDISLQGNKSWADEFTVYQNSFKSLQAERTSTGSTQLVPGSGFKIMKPSDDQSYVSDLTQYSLSGDEKTQEEMTDKSVYRPDVPGDAWNAPVDRKYDVLRFTVPQSTQDYKQLKSVGGEKPRTSIEQLAEELSHQTPPTSMDDRTSNVGMSSETSSVDIPGVRRSPLGHLESEFVVPASNIYPKTRESISSTMSDGMMSSASSYMEMQLHGRSMNDMGTFIQEQNQRGREPNSQEILEVRSREPSFHPQDKTPVDSRMSASSTLENFNRHLGYTSTPFTYKFPNKVVAVSRFSDVSNSISQDVNQGSTSLLDSQMALSSIRTEMANNRSGQDSRGSLLSFHTLQKDPGTSLSQYILKSETPGKTLIGQDNSALSQYTLNTDSRISADRPTLSQYTLNTDSQISTDKPTLSQYTLNTDSQISADRPTLSQYTLNTDSRISADRPTLSQYTLNTDSRISADRPTLSQYTLNTDSQISADRPTLSQYTLNTDSQFSADNGQENPMLTQYTLNTDSQFSAHSGQDKPTLSQYTLNTDSQFSADNGQENPMLTQYTLDTDSQFSSHSVQEKPTLSQYTLNTDSQISADSGREKPTLSQYTLNTDSQFSANTSHLKSTDPFLTQYSLDSSRKSQGSSQNETSLTQITLESGDLDFSNKRDSSSQLKSFDDKGDKTDPSFVLSQHSLTSNVTGELSLSQHSLDNSGSPSRTAGEELSNISLPETTQTGTSLSQYSLASDASDDALVEKRFTNLDNLLKESKDLIAKHKELVSKNINENHSDNTQSEKINLGDHQSKIDELAAQYGFHKSDFIEDEPSAPDSSRISTTTGSSFNVLEESTPLKTEDSITIVTKSLPSDVYSSSLDQIGHETGISDEPNLTLVSSDMSMNQENMNQLDGMTPRSDGVNSGSQGSDSTLSFEQHEVSFNTEQENSENTDRSSHDAYDFSAMKPLYLQGLRSFKWTEELDSKEDTDSPNRSLSPPKEPPPPPPEDLSSEDSEEDPDTPRDSGDEIFHAVPVVISPSVSLSMKFNSSQEFSSKKLPVSWSSLLDEGKSGGSDTANKAAVRHEAGSSKPVVQPRKSLEISTRKGPGLISRSLEIPRKPADAALSHSLDKNQNSSSVSDRRKAFEAGSTTIIPSKSTGAVPTKSINSALQIKDRPVSTENKKSAATSEPGKFTSAGALSLGEFLKSQKASESTALKSTGLPGSNRPKSAPSGLQKEKGSSDVVKSDSATWLSKTMSSWKKNRSVKSSAPPPKPVQSKEMPTTAVRVLPRDAIPTLAEEEKRRAAEKKKYDRNMRAYNPRLFRLCSKLDEDDDVEQEVKPKKSEDREKQRQAVAAANRDKVKEFQKKLNENMKKKQALKKQQQESKK